MLVLSKGKSIKITHDVELIIFFLYIINYHTDKQHRSNQNLMNLFLLRWFPFKNMYILASCNFGLNQSNKCYKKLKTLQCSYSIGKLFLVMHSILMYKKVGYLKRYYYFLIKYRNSKHSHYIVNDIIFTIKIGFKTFHNPRYWLNL